MTAGSALKLWEHQIEAIAAVEAQLAAGRKRTLVVMATGTGKTTVYLTLVNKWAEAGSRVLILAHRRELIHQPVERARAIFPILAKKMGVVMARLDESDAQVIVATVQTVSRSQNRLEDIGKFDYVVLDECHHVTAKSYMKLVEYFPDAEWVGLTATPFRTDGESLARAFDSVAYRFPITAAIDQGVLVPFDAYGFSLPVSVSGVEETVDGWAEDVLGSLLSASNVLEVVFEKWQEYCSDRKTICFTASVGQAHATAQYFRSQGISAEAVDGTTPKKRRDAILKSFQTGEIQVVANCQVWTEGVDVPEASAALMVCPTKSDLTYVQKLGRVLRTCKDKANAIILDFAPLEERNVVMAGDILGVPRKVEKATNRAKREGVLVGAVRVDDFGLAVSVDPTDILVEALKYLRKGNLAWALQEGLAVASLSQNAMLVVELPNASRVAMAESLRSAGNGNWDQKKELLYQSVKSHRLWICVKEGTNNYWMANYAGSFNDMERAVETGETMTSMEYYAPGLAKKKKLWRKKPVTLAQLGYMRRLGIIPPEGCTSGQAAQLISHRLASRAVDAQRAKVESMIMKGEIQ